MLELVLAVRDRLSGGKALQDWAAQWHQGLPGIMIGYSKPRIADGWPFVALVAGTSGLQFANRNSGRAAVHLICGVRYEGIGEDGYVAAARLDMAALEDIRAGGGFGGSDWNAVAVETRLLDINLSHPNFEIERAVIFSVSIQ